MKTAEQRILGRDYKEDDPSWLFAYVYAHDEGDPDVIARKVAEAGFSYNELARALVHAIRARK